MERIKSNLEKNYELDFDSTASLFYEGVWMFPEKWTFNFMSFMSPFQGVLHKEFATKTFTNRVDFWKNFLNQRQSAPKQVDAIG